MSGSAANGEFRKKNILMAGAGRGIGKRIALGFARQGARVALLGRSKAELIWPTLKSNKPAGMPSGSRRRHRPEQLTGGQPRHSRLADPLTCWFAPREFPGHYSRSCKHHQSLDRNHSSQPARRAHSCRAVLPSMIEKRSGKIIALTCDSDSLPKANFSAYTTSKPRSCALSKPWPPKSPTIMCKSTVSIPAPPTRI